MNARIIAVLALGVMAVGVQPAAAQMTDEQQIRGLEQHFVNAVIAKDLDGIMQVYVPNDTLHVFDVVPPRQYVGIAAYRKDWAEFLKTFEGTPQFEIRDLAILIEGNLAISHSAQHFTGKKPNGEPVDLTVRVTDAYKKFPNGIWLIVHEHVSIPVNFETGLPDIASTP